MKEPIRHTDIGNELRILFNRKYSNRKRFADENYQALGVNTPSAAYKYITKIFDGFLYGTHSTTASKKKDFTKLYAILDTLDVTKDDVVLYMLEDFSPQFNYTPKR